MNKRDFLRTLGLPALSALGAAALPPAAHAAIDAGHAFPARPVRIVVPVAAGGSADKLTRLLAERLTALWGQAVVVENITGASGVIGAQKVASAKADGYTLLQAGEGLSLNAILFQDLPYDRHKAFTPVTQAVVNPQILVVNPATGVHTFGDYLARLRARPESLSLGLPVHGGIAHIAHELITQETGARVNYIPYPGGGPAALAVIAGHVDATLITLAAVTEFVRAGKLRPLAVTTAYRSPALPEVPTIAESGLPGFAVESWQGYVAPAGTPPEVVAKLNRDLQTVLKAPEVRGRLEDMGFKVVAGSAGDLHAVIDREQVRYGKAIRTAGITVR